MIEVLNSIGQFFASIGEFVKYIITSTWKIIQWCLDSVTLTNRAFTYFLPIGVIATLITFIAIAVIYKVFGRTS